MDDSRPGRGTSHSSRARPADRTPISYGSDLLATTSRGWARFLLVTSPRAYAAVRGRLAARPAGIAHVDSLEVRYLERTTTSLPSDADLVVGAGGGQVIDAAKYVAAMKQVPLIQVPTIISSGAIVHSYLGTFRGSTLVGGRDDWVWADSDAVLVDYELVLSSPAHLNTAGLGDILCEHSGISEWKLTNGGAQRPRSDSAALARLLAFHRTVARSFEATLRDGALTAESVRCIMESLRSRDAQRIDLATAPQVDHQFLADLETTSSRHWIHGEVVALGAVIVAWLCGGDTQRLVSRLDRCLVRWRPSDIELQQCELRLALTTLSESLAASPGTSEYTSVARSVRWTDDTFAELWEFLDRR
jgi:glycerol-1-phosphate dehydrogenase [NAD(P)+]